MSSVTWNDLTCSQNASAMSCLAMRDLALKELEANQTQLSYLLLDPSCERYHNSTFDKGALNGTVLSRRLCFTHDPKLKEGSYQQQYQDTFAPKYEQWTRRKDISVPKPEEIKNPINADIWNNMNDDGTAVLKCGTGGIAQKVMPSTSMPYGISATEQSSVPADFLSSMGCCK